MKTYPLYQCLWFLQPKFHTEFGEEKFISNNVESMDRDNFTIKVNYDDFALYCI